MIILFVRWCDVEVWQFGVTSGTGGSKFDQKWLSVEECCFNTNTSKILILVKTLLPPQFDNITGCFNNYSGIAQELLVYLILIKVH